MVSSRVIALHALGVPPEEVRRLANTGGMACWSPDLASGPDGDDRVVVLVGESGAEAEIEDPALWGPPYAAWIEVRDLAEDALRGILDHARRTDLLAFFTTATANSLHLAGRIVAAVTARRPLVSDTQRDDIELALHEAISNAVVHGNLQVEGMRGLSVDALDRFSADLAARMADPEYARRRVEVSCWIEPASLLVEVADQGTGFAPSDRRECGASGRGLDLICAIAQSYELLDSGRRIRMRFAL